jgi:hypothetical protein
MLTLLLFVGIMLYIFPTCLLSKTFIIECKYQFKNKKSFSSDILFNSLMVLALTIIAILPIVNLILSVCFVCEIIKIINC